MRYSQADIETMLGHTPTDFKRQEEIGRSLFDQPEARNAPRPRKLLRAALAASLILCFAFTTGIGQAVAQAIEEFVFGSSTVIREANDEGVILRLQLHDRDVPEDFYRDHKAAYLPLNSMDEVLAVAPFTFRLPTYLPDGMQPVGFKLEQLDTGAYGYDALVTFEVPKKGKYFITLTTYYVGEAGYAKLETPYEIEKVMVGDIEASLLQDRYEDSVTTMLVFKKNGVFYELFSVEYGADELIRIAESI